jgi:hypothetical protein
VSLSEAQIQRYSRQILLQGVGGVGQARLLAGVVEVLGEGPALDTAAAYLAAGGSPVLREGQWLDGRDPAVDPERGPGAAVAVTVVGGVLAAPPASAVAVVRVCPATLVYRSAGGCEACFRSLVVEGPAPQGALATLAGTLAALLCQKLLLGSLAGVGRVELGGDGALTGETAPPCDACGR